MAQGTAMTSWSRLAGVLALGASLAAFQDQAPGTAGQKPPAFKSGVDLVAVDVNVVDRNGQPVAGLTADQFELSVDGKPRRVASATFLDYASAKTVPGAVPEAVPGQPLRIDRSFSSNEVEEADTAAPGRVLVLAIDQLSFPPGSGRAAIESARKFLDRLQPVDRVGLVAYPSPGPTIAPTTDHGTVREALGRVQGMADVLQSLRPYITVSEALAMDRNDTMVRQEVINRECASEKGASEVGMYSGVEACVRRIDTAVPSMVSQLEAQARRSVNGLQSAVDTIGGIRGPKTLVVVSAGLIPWGSPHLDVRAEIEAVAYTASLSNTRLYVLHVSTRMLEAYSAERMMAPETAFQDETALASGLQMLAGMSAGMLFTVTVGADFAFDRVAKETSAAYVLGFEPEAADRDGKSHRIQVRVRVPDATVRSRASFMVPRAAPVPATPDEAVAAALKPGRLARDLPIRLTAQTLRDPSGGQMRVVIAANIGRGAIGPADMRVGFAIFDVSGRQVGGGVDRMRLQPRGSGGEASWAYVSSVILRPGLYALRFAAASAEGLVGSIDYSLDARLRAGEGAALSDVLILDPARPPGQNWVTVVDGRIAAPRLEVYQETYPVKGRSVSAVAFDVVDRPDGPPVVGVRTKPVSAEGGRRFTASADVDVRLVPPGDYLVTATAFDGEAVLGKTSRPFRLELLPTSPGGPRAAFSVAESGGLVRAFGKQDALTPEALQYFLNRLQETDSAASELISSASASVRGGHFDEAIAALAAAESDRLAVPFLRGLALLGKGDLEAAAAQFRQALRVDSEFLPAAFYLGACYAAGGRDREAAGAWQTSLVSESEARIVFDVLADALLRLGDGEQAESIIREALGRWPDDDRFVPRLSAAEAMQRRRTEALATLDPYLDRHPDDTSAWFLGMRILYDAHAGGGAVTTQAEDGARAARYAAAYTAAGGPQAALVDRWAAFVQKRKAGR
jgi:VWFA-related protein